MPQTPPSSDDFFSWKRSLFRYYSWFITLYCVGNYYRAFINAETPADGLTYLDAFVSFPSVIAVVFFAYRRSILHRWFWRLYFPFIVGWDLVLGVGQAQNKDLQFWAHYGMLLPLYYAIFRMGYDSRIWNPTQK